MNGPNLQNVATFLKVVEVGGFASAARELGVTQSTVSRRVAELERHLRRKLLERTTRRLLLTEAGARYCETVKALISGLAEADENLGDGGTEAEGLLRITMPLGLGRAVVLPGLARFAKLHPHIRLDVDLSDRYVDILQEGYDFAVRFAEPQTSGLDAKSVRSVERIICATPQFFHANPVERAKDLEIDRCLVQRTYAPILTWSVVESGAVRTLQIAPRMVLSEIYSVYEMTLAGMGAAILPDFLIENDLMSGRLVRLQNITLSARPIVLVWPSHKTNLRRIVALRGFLEELLT
ncbi:LysR family transcriptional regulator [Bradyrhizobium diazoefficiens]|nr:LysR family transcriptional regulator [Bradyrhizobium diazoefficiens]QQN66389.1 LysR family transcriptional regulator [Bradyrhizobium diazoefficiens]